MIAHPRSLVLVLLPQATGLQSGEPPSRVPVAVDVPLRVLPGSDSLGVTQGVSFLDFDADGWIDVFVNLTGALRRNVDGQAFPIVADLDAFLAVPPGSSRYGASCADYDEDGLPDIAGEPRISVCLYLLKNLDGAGTFLDVAPDPAIVPAPLPCAMMAETFCWADADDDGDLDLFAPAYPDEVFAGSGGNRFYENLGPTGPDRAYRFALRTETSGLEIPPGVARPEGAQFVDADRDGDLDLYSNGTFYQNVSRSVGPRFRALDGAATGISLGTVLDEGLLFLDHDMDGDQDLFVLLYPLRNAIYDNRGDGTFVELSDVLQSPDAGDTGGCSAADWDLDGDLDLTTTSILRRNLLIETGTPYFRLATHALQSLTLGILTPAWGDWDKDGDLDCALGNVPFPGAFLQNTTYDALTPASQRLALRVRPVKDSALVTRGLETEFGASVEVRVRGDATGRIRRNFTASSHGYLQQGEYALTFGLPAGPDPGAPASGVVFDLSVDFPSREDRGILRVDRDVNPVLGDVVLAALQEREITVFRSGRVRIDGSEFPPAGRYGLRLASTGRLTLPGDAAPLLPPAVAPAPSWFVGLELDTRGALGPARIAELVVDGQLDDSTRARCGANVVLWDVTPGETPHPAHAHDLAPSPGNDRAHLPLSAVLKSGRVYRLLCRVKSLRASPLDPRSSGPIPNRGGISFANPNPCDGAVVRDAPLRADQAYLELRYRPTNVGAGLGR